MGSQSPAPELLYSRSRSRSHARSRAGQLPEEGTRGRAAEAEIGKGGRRPGFSGSCSSRPGSLPVGVSRAGLPPARGAVSPSVCAESRCLQDRHLEESGQRLGRGFLNDTFVLYFLSILEYLGVCC